ncbi:type II toxin-antitoxin system Phd/YefM family antitoxin [Desulfonatronum thiodismutans]|uniref:type II toxin-antitoxin system Phd/YefM family antitoxin n=1 Tax=Desulfonatronum thiodismutans TaxID=159290 RepID=UPI0004ABE606|nr:type II toxin-antitoxin system Phd/YefM family antitoxin [Desulfonatronum thiodismutans]
MQTIYTDKIVSVTELKRNFTNVLNQAGSDPVAILNHNKVAAYLLSAEHYERLIDRLEDIEDGRIIRERSAGPFVEVSMDDL